LTPSLQSYPSGQASRVPDHPAQPAGPGDHLALSNGGSGQRIALRRSALLFGASAGFVALAVAAVCSTLAARFALLHVAAAGLVTLAVLCTALAHQERRRPASLEIGPDGMSMRNRAGRLVAHGRIAGCVQWSGSLLGLTLVGDNGRTHTLLIATDMLPAGRFRALAVEARRAVHGAL
jgi:hypothetical protein